MSKRKTVDIKEEEFDEDENISDDDHSKKKTLRNKEKGWNWKAIVIMLMFFLPALLALVLQLVDYLYPEAAIERRFKERVTQCYEVANPSKVSEVDKFVKRYRGKEHVLLAQLRSKYGHKHTECNN